MDIIKKINLNLYNFYFKKNGIIDINKYNLFRNYHSELYLFAVIKKYYNFVEIKIPDLTNYNFIDSETININKLLLYKYFKSVKNLYYIDNFTSNINKKIIFYKNNIEDGLKNLYIKNMLYKIVKLNYNINLSEEYERRNLYFGLTIEYLIRKLELNKKNYNDNNIFIKLFYDIYIFYIRTEIKLKYNIEYSSFPNYNELYNFLNKKGYVHIFYKDIVPTIKRNYKKFINIINNSTTYPEFKEIMKKKIKPLSTIINIDKIIDTYYTDKNERKYIKNKLKKMKQIKKI